MISLLALWLGREVRFGRESRRLPIHRAPWKPRLEVLEDRNLLSFWTTVAPMPTGRIALAAATAPNGRIYAMGGARFPINSLKTVEAYDPFTNAWTTVAPMPTGRSGLAAATGVDGRIYAIG